MTCQSTPSLTITQGASKKWLFTLRDQSGTALDLTAATLYFRVKDDTNDRTNLIEKVSTVAGEIDIIAPATGGQARVTLAPDDTKEMVPGDYVYDMWLDDGTGEQIPVTGVSKFTVRARVTVL